MRVHRIRARRPRFPDDASGLLLKVVPGGSTYPPINRNLLVHESLVAGHLQYSCGRVYKIFGFFAAANQKPRSNHVRFHDLAA